MTAISPPSSGSASPHSYEPLHPWKIRVLEEDDSLSRAALTLLKDLFRCRLESHAQQVAYMASSHWYLRWNTRLASQCRAPAKGQQQRGIQEQHKESQELAKGWQVTQGQKGASEQVIQKHLLQKRGQQNKEQTGQHTDNRIQQEATRNLYKEQHHVSISHVVQEPVWRGQDQQSEIGRHQKRVHAGEKWVKQQLRSSDGKEASSPSCDDASYVSEVCRRSPLHVAKVSHHQHTLNYHTLRYIMRELKET